MGLELVTIPCLSDNYAFLVHDAASGATALVDVPEPGPILSELSSRGWRLTDVLLTHHHNDHIGGLPGLIEGLADQASPRVIGAAADAHRLPALDLAVSDGDTVDVCGEPCAIFDVSGHTMGHIAFHFPTSQIVFTADSLMALGCGRLFEGTAERMWESLSTLGALPPETIVCSGHEYTAANGAFAVTIEPDNPALISRIDDIRAARDRGEPTVPSTLALELATNPFLRAAQADVAANVNLAGAAPAKVFAEIRKRKDHF